MQQPYLFGQRINIYRKIKRFFQNRITHAPSPYPPLIPQLRAKRARLNSSWSQPALRLAASWLIGTSPRFIRLRRRSVPSHSAFSIQCSVSSITHSAAARQARTASDGAQFRPIPHSAFRIQHFLIITAPSSGVCRKKSFGSGYPSCRSRSCSNNENSSLVYSNTFCWSSCPWALR